MKAWKISDVGISRKGKPNEDICLLEDIGQGCMLGVVCDGMGGENAGEVASEMAATAFRQAFLRDYDRWSASHVEKCLKTAIKEANDRVFQAAVNDTSFSGMGTTIVAAVIGGDGEAVLANVGDSRAYYINEEGISQITTDHSLVNELIIRGEISRIEAQRHPKRNLITRAIGADPRVRCDTYVKKIRRGDYILLCSDGLNDQVSGPEIYYEVYESGKPEQACENLVAIANSRGGSDNITIILIEI